MREGKRNQYSRFERLSVILRVRLFSRRLARAKNGRASARFARGKDAFFDLNFSHARTDMESIRGEARWQELKRFRISLRMIHKELGGLLRSGTTSCRDEDIPKNDTVHWHTVEKQNGHIGLFGGGRRRKATANSKETRRGMTRLQAHKVHLLSRATRDCTLIHRFKRGEAFSEVLGFGYLAFTLELINLRVEITNQPCETLGINIRLCTASR